MQEFIRARSPEQKEQRLSQIKDVVKHQFASHPYHEITLTTIAEELGWSRANLYKYVSTKEEIFLLLTADECSAYYDALLTALPIGCEFSIPTIAEVWAGIANAHKEFFRLSDLLSTIIETNVTVERLKDFKRCYYDCLAKMQERLPQIMSLNRDAVEPLMLAIYYHAIGYVNGFCSNPLVAEALEQLNIQRPQIDFRSEMGDFISMCLAHYTA